MQNNQDNQNNDPQISNQQGDQTANNYKEINFTDTLLPNEIRLLRLFKNEGCCCCNCCGSGILGKINYFLVISIIALIFNISGIISSFNFVPEYNDLRNILLIKLEEEKLLNNYTNNHDIKHLWYNLRWKQNAIFLSNAIIFIFLFIFEIIQKSFYNTIMKKEKKKGKIKSIMILINFIFNLIFIIMSLLTFYFFIYEIIIVFIPPYKKKEKNYFLEYITSDTIEEEKLEEEILYNKVIYYGIANVIAMFMVCTFNIVLCFISKIIYIYLDLNFEDNKNSNNIVINNATNNQNYITTINNINSVNNMNRGNIVNNNNTVNIINNININTDKMKATSIFIGGKYINIQIETNKNIYLEELNSKKKIKFKHILLEGVTNNFIYIKINNEIIENMLSISDWEYPKFDQAFIYLDNTFSYIYAEMCLLPLSIYFYANECPIYFEIKEVVKNGYISDIKYMNIFNIYGNFEKGVTASRFYLYIVALIFIFLFKIKRVYYGGKTNSFLKYISIVLGYLLIILNFVFFILSIILIVFGILSLNAESNYSAKFKEIYEIKIDDDMLVIGIVMQIIVSFSFLLDFCKVYTCSLYLFSYIKKINNNIDDLNNNQESNEVVQSEINYLGLDSIKHTLYEYQINGHPRYLYYSFKNENRAQDNGDNKDNKDIKDSREQNIIIIKDKNNNKSELLNSKNILIEEEQEKPTGARSIKNI